MNKAESALIVGLLQAGWPNHPFGKHSPTVYAMALDDISYADAERAVSIAVKQNTFCPSPAELRKIALGDSLTAIASAEEAWEAVMAEVRRIGGWGEPHFADKLTARAVAAIGWDQICQSEKLSVERGHFLRIYAAFRDRAVQEVVVPSLADARREPTPITAGWKKIGGAA